mgnify:CR=1 FL=1
MSDETIKTYRGSSVGVSQCLVTLEGFIGDMENAELADDSTVDASDAVTAINALIWEMEKREAEIERLRAALTDIVNAADNQDHDNLTTRLVLALGAGRVAIGRQQQPAGSKE